MKFSTILSISFSDSSSLYTFSICPHLPSVPGADRLILRPIVMVHFFYQIKGRIRCLNVFEDFSLYCMGFIQFRTEYQSICCLFTCFCISFSSCSYVAILRHKTANVNTSIATNEHFYLDYICSM